jgi:hypothetical protein
LDFDHPLGQTWSGYLMPDELREEPCEACEGSGCSPYAIRLGARWCGNAPFDPAETGSTPYTAATPAVRAFAERNVTNWPHYYGRGELAIFREATRLARLFNEQWSHHLDQDDVNALLAANRLKDFTHEWVGGKWQRITPQPVVTAEQVNLWSIGSMGHDAINRSVVVGAACERAGQDRLCAECGGNGTTEKYPGQRAEAEAWDTTEPPTGEGWQLWEITSEGSPISPVFTEADDLAQWMTRNPCGFAGATFDLETARKFVGVGWAPSMVYSSSTGLVDGITAVARGGEEQS